MAVVGSFARVDAARREEALAGLSAIEGVETFDIDDNEKIGLYLEAESLDAAHACLKDAVEAVEGVLGVWPVFVNIEDELDPGSAVAGIRPDCTDQYQAREAE